MNWINEEGSYYISVKKHIYCKFKLFPNEYEIVLEQHKFNALRTCPFLKISLEDSELEIKETFYDMGTLLSQPV